MAPKELNKAQKNDRTPDPHCGKFIGHCQKPLGHAGDCEVRWPRNMDYFDGNALSTHKKKRKTIASVLDAELAKGRMPCPRCGRLVGLDRDGRVNNPRIFRRKLPRGRQEGQSRLTPSTLTAPEAIQSAALWSAAVKP